MSNNIKKLQISQIIIKKYIIIILIKVHSIFIDLTLPVFMTAIVPSDEDFFLDGPESPQLRPIILGPDLDLESDPQPQPQVPEAARRRRAVACSTYFHRSHSS